MKRRVAVFGDSISKGIIYEDDRLQRLTDSAVNIIATEYGYEISNYSQYGQTLKKLDAKKAVGRFLQEIKEDEVDYAVFCIGGNDADYNWKVVAADPEFDHQPNTPREEFEEILKRNVSLLKQSGVQVILTTIPPVDSQRYFDNVISKTADGQKVLQFFGGDVTNISRHQEAYNFSIVKVAAVLGCPVIDLRTGFLMDRKYLRNYCIDGIHPNGGGHRFMAEQIVKSLAAQGIVLKKQY